jgi:hypothetical protein
MLWKGIRCLEPIGTSNFLFSTDIQSIPVSFHGALGICTTQWTGCAVKILSEKAKTLFLIVP